MPLVAVYDANVLYPSTLRDILIRVAQVGLVQAKWTDRILDETFRNLKAKRPDLDPRKLDRTRELTTGAIRDVLVKGYEPLIEAVDLPDPEDRHVLAAAIRAKAQAIVTFNLKDFPEDKLAVWDVRAVHPDAFIEAQIGLSPPAGVRDAGADSRRVGASARRGRLGRDRLTGAGGPGGLGRGATGRGVSRRWGSR